MKDEPKASALLVALDLYKHSYDEHSETWRDIERKAQGNTAIAGAFLGATAIGIQFAAGSDRLPFALLAVVLGASVFCSIMAMSVATFDGPECLEGVGSSLSRVLGCSTADSEQAFTDFATARLAALREATADLDCTNTAKSAWVSKSQGCMLAALFVAVVAIVNVLLSAGSTGG